MNNDLKNHKYWIISGIAVIIILVFAYNFTIYKTYDVKLTRPQAIEIANNYLLDLGVSTQGLYSEAFVDDQMIQNRYLLKSQGLEKYKELYNNLDYSLFNWAVLFHQNLSKEIPQLSYRVTVDKKGNVSGFTLNIQDSATIPSLKEQEALILAKNFLADNAQIDLSAYTLKENKQDNLPNRIDYKFHFTKKVEELNSSIDIITYVQGNRIGGYNINLEVPEAYKDYFNVSEYIFGSFSAVFVFFLLLISAFLFLKKYHQGEVWVSAGRNLFIIYFILSIFSFVNLWPGFGQGVNIGNLSFTTVKIIVAMLNGLIIYFFLSLLLFTTWTVGESYARSLWPEKLNGIDAFINAHLFSTNSGSSLFKGWVLGLIIGLVYLISPLVLNQQNAFAFIGTYSSFGIFSGYAPVISVVLDSIASATLASIAIVFFIVNISYQRWKKKWLSIVLTGVVTVLATVISETPPSINNFAVGLIKDFLFGCFVAYLYFKFDLLTIASMFFTTSIVYKGFIIGGSSNDFFQLNFILVILALLTTPLIYVVSRVRKEEYVFHNFGLPSHIQRISERERLKKELEIAAKVQLSLLPKEEPNVPGYDISAVSIPAVEAGGDYFDFVKLSGNKLGIAIGDVSGKGVGAAIYMTLTKGILQAHAEEDASPKNVLAKVNRLLYKTIEKNSFVSMFYAILDVNNHQITYARAGHNPGILTSRESGGTKLLLSKGMALGLEEGSMFSSNLNEETIEIKQGDVLVLYTDGFTEAMNKQQECFGDDKFIQLIEKNRNISSKELENLILQEVEEFVDGAPQHDDMTMVIVKRN